MSAVIIVPHHVAVAELVETGGNVPSDEIISEAWTIGHSLRAAAVFDNGIAGGCADDRQMVVISTDVRCATGKNLIVVICVHDQRKRQLPDAVFAGRAPPLFLGRGESRQEQRRQDGDDGDDDEQFDERKRWTLGGSFNKSKAES